MHFYKSLTALLIRSLSSPLYMPTHFLLAQGDHFQVSLRPSPMSATGSSVAFLNIGTVSTKLWVSDAESLKLHSFPTPAAVGPAKHCNCAGPHRSFVVDYVSELWFRHGLGHHGRIVFLVDTDDHPTFGVVIQQLLLSLAPALGEVQLEPCPRFVAMLNGVCRHSSVLVIDLGHSRTRLCPVLVDGVLWGEAIQYSCSLLALGAAAALDAQAAVDYALDCLTDNLERLRQQVAGSGLAQHQWCVLLTGGGCDDVSFRGKACIAVASVLPNWPIHWS